MTVGSMARIVSFAEFAEADTWFVPPHDEEVWCSSDTTSHLLAQESSITCFAGAIAMKRRASPDGYSPLIAPLSTSLSIAIPRTCTARSSAREFATLLEHLDDDARLTAARQTPHSSRATELPLYFDLFRQRRLT